MLDKGLNSHWNISLTLASYWGRTKHAGTEIWISDSLIIIIPNFSRNQSGRRFLWITVWSFSLRTQSCQDIHVALRCDFYPNDHPALELVLLGLILHEEMAEEAAVTVCWLDEWTRPLFHVTYGKLPALSLLHVVQVLLSNSCISLSCTVSFYGRDGSHCSRWLIVTYSTLAHPFIIRAFLSLFLPWKASLSDS